MSSPELCLSIGLPAVVFPVHDPSGSFLDHRQRITPLLKAAFARAIVSISPATHIGVEELAGDAFFEVVRNRAGSPVGEHFLAGYRRAVELCPPEQQLHLCFEDRLAFALLSEYREAFLRDVRLAERSAQPVLFQRSRCAWLSHPRTYQAIESMATRAGEVLFGRSLDFAWCHLAVRAGRLGEILPVLDGIRDLSLPAQMVIALKDELITRDVDWLAWEDPFILGRDAEELRAAQEQDSADHEKRLAYVLAMVRAMLGSCQRISGAD